MRASGRGNICVVERGYGLCYFCSLTTCILTAIRTDYEIFELNDAIQTDLGSNITFYNWIGIKSSADQKTLNKAYRKKASEYVNCGQEVRP
jgi:hypothetical protein